MRCRFVLPQFLTLKNFEGLDLGKMDQVRVSLRVVCISVRFFSPTETDDERRSVWRLQANDSGLASYVAGQIDRTLSWKVCLFCCRCRRRRITSCVILRAVLVL